MSKKHGRSGNVRRLGAGLEILERREYFSADCLHALRYLDTPVEFAPAIKSAGLLASAATDDRYENNDTRATAANLGTISSTFTANDLVLNDADWYRFSLSSTGQTQDAVVISFLHWQGDIDLQLYNSAGTPLNVSEGTGNSERISLAGRGAGTYFLRVYGYAGATNPNYDLTIRRGSAATDDRLEENDTRATATDLKTPAFTFSLPNLVMADSADWFRFTTNTVGQGDDQVSINFVHAQGDLDLELYNAAGTVIARSDGTSNSEAISLSGRAAGTYYVRVYGYQGASNPNYTLNVNPPPLTNTQPKGGFDIEIDYTGLTASQRAIFEQAAQKWESVITNDLPNATLNGRAIDDLLISASSTAIDGVGGILGQAGPERLRANSFLPYYGTMEFDSADMASMEKDGTLYSVVLHEMGHVLGIGTIWDNLGLLRGAGTSNPVFVGANALAAYNQIFGVNATGVPVENGGGPGTRDSHWRDSVFSNELMTGYIGPGVVNPLSRVTVGSLADLGYSVNYAAADPYSAP